MGIVHCADEAAGYLGAGDEMIEKHLGYEWENSIYNITTEVLRRSKQKNQTPQQVALEMAEQKSLELHPIFGHRSIHIIKSLTA